MEDDNDREAADWLSRLRTRSLGNADLAAFAAWRRLPGNAEAYARMERLWDDVGTLDGDQEVRRAVDALTAPPRRRSWMPKAPLVASLAALALVLTVVGLLAGHGPGETYRTRLGERTTVRLADGSRVVVDAQSDLAVSLGAKRRSLDLHRGRALFDVEHDAVRPFEVRTASGVVVRALGTRFAVSFDGTRTGVALLRGRVSVTRRGETLATLAPGETLEVSPEGETKRSGGAADAASWSVGRLVFRGVPLEAAVGEMNRYASPAIRIASGAAGSEPVSGEFSSDDPDGFVGAVNVLLGAGSVSRERAPE